MTKQYLVKWRNPATGAAGQGNPVQLETAYEILADNCKQFPDYVHWIEQAPAVEGWNWGVLGFPGKKAKEGKR